MLQRRNSGFKAIGEKRHSIIEADARAHDGMADELPKMGRFRQEGRNSSTIFRPLYCEPNRSSLVIQTGLAHEIAFAVAQKPLRKRWGFLSI